jgi:glycosyltransferase involved in cell wall biosynthesis
MEKKDPKISVLIPNFNLEKYIGATLESVLAQTYAPHEIIVVDDGSADGSLTVINEFAAKDSRIKLIVQANRGLVAARNAGLAVATGDYIAMVDADDVWTADALAVRVKLAERFPDADVIATDFAWFQEELPAEPVGRVGLGQRGAHAFAQAFQSNEPMLLTSPFELVATIHFAWVGATLVKRQSMAAVGNFDPAFQGPEDTLLWLRLANRGTFVFAPAITAFYRQRAGSIVHTWKGPKELQYLQVLEWLQARPEFATHKRTIAKLLAECHHASAMHYRRIGSRMAAWKHAVAAFRFQPHNLGYWRNVVPWGL